MSNNILNRSYKRVGDLNSDIFIVKSVENDFVEFNNGARCKLITLLSDFEEVSINENASTLSTVITDTTEINPDTFFNTPISETDSVMEQFENVVKNPNNITQSQKLQDSIDLDSQYQKVTPGGSSNNLANRMSDTKINNNLNIDNNNNNIDNNIDNNIVRLPEWDVFDRVKKNDVLEVMIPLSIKLPKPQKIDALDDMFDSSFISYLSKQYIKEHITNNSFLLQKQIQEAIEEWVDEIVYDTVKKPPKKKTTNVKKKTTNVKKAVVKKAVVKKPTTKNITKKKKPNTVDKIIKNDISTENNIINDTLGFFNNTPPWDGNIKTLLMINTNEQFLTVKKKYEILLENNPQGNDRYRFEDMLDIYTEQLKDLNKDKK